MAGSNEFLLFGLGGGANVITQSAYVALAARTAGFIAGTANSAELNKVWRQSAFVASSLAQIIANNNVNIADDGNVSSFITKFLAALFVSPALTGVPTAPTPTTADNSTLIATTAFVRNNLSSYYTASQVASNFATISQVNTAQATANTANTVASNALNNAATAQSTATTAQTNVNNLAVSVIGTSFLSGYGDYTGSKGFNAQYTNTSGRPWFVTIDATSTSGDRFFQAFVNGVPAAATTATQSTGRGRLSFIVNIGATYQVNSAGNLIIQSWYELH